MDVSLAQLRRELGSKPSDELGSRRAHVKRALRRQGVSNAIQEIVTVRDPLLEQRSHDLGRTCWIRFRQMRERLSIRSIQSMRQVGWQDQDEIIDQGPK
jgi:hypothetical protein